MSSMKFLVGMEELMPGRNFFEWINGNRMNDSLKLIIGGKLTEELSLDSRVLDWLTEGDRRGRVVRVADWELEIAKDNIGNIKLKSNDKHIIELAVSSGARLLYSNDKELHKDFRSPNVINKPRGKVYSTLKSSKSDKRKRKLLKEAQCDRCSGKV